MRQVCLVKSHYLDPEIRNMLVRGMLGNKNSSFHSGP